MPNSRMADARATSLPWRPRGIIRIAALCVLCRSRHKTHWTGHHSRLQREGVTSSCPFGSPGYAFEELIAEMGAAFLCAYAGIQGEVRHEGYIDSWLSLLKTDKRAIFRASGQARSASEYMLNLEQQLKQVVLDDSLCMNDGA